MVERTDLTRMLLRGEATCEERTAVPEVTARVELAPPAQPLAGEAAEDVMSVVSQTVAVETAEVAVSANPVVVRVAEHSEPPQEAGSFSAPCGVLAEAAAEAPEPVVVVAAEVAEVRPQPDVQVAAEAQPAAVGNHNSVAVQIDCSWEPMAPADSYP